MSSLDIFTNIFNGTEILFESLTKKYRTGTVSMINKNKFFNTIVLGTEKVTKMWRSPKLSTSGCKIILKKGL